MKLFASALLASAFAVAVAAPASAGDCPYAKDRSASTSDTGLPEDRAEFELLVRHEVTPAPPIR